jgi:cyclase
MLIIPAIDIIDGQCVRLTKGEFQTKKVYSSSPLDVAKNFEREGATMLHIIDLDAAKTGVAVNKNIILQIAKTVDIPLEVGGGIRNIDTARQYLNSGIQRIILGTKAITEPDLLTALINEFGNRRIMVALEIKNGQIAISGWQQTLDRDYLDVAKQLKNLGVTEILSTDVDKDGSLTEPNFKLVGQLVEMGFNVVASGGIADLESLKKLKGLNVSAAILGKALYENKINLQEALKIGQPISNLTKRIIPCLDVMNGNVVKGISFGNLQIVGDPVELGERYSEQGADELVFLDITASKENRQTLFNVVAEVAEKVFIPFTVGGGIKTTDEIRKLLQLGADKISINSSAILRPEFISEAAKTFGQQCIVVAIDAKKVGNQYKVFLKGGTQETQLDAISWAMEAEKRGAGEILLTSMDKDGTKSGYDLELLKEVSQRVNIPVIASGGAGSLEDLKFGLTIGKADAVLVASLFHYQRLTISEVKNYLSANNIPIRI